MIGATMNIRVPDANEKMEYADQESFLRTLDKVSEFSSGQTNIRGFELESYNVEMKKQNSKRGNSYSDMQEYANMISYNFEEDYENGADDAEEDDDDGYPGTVQENWPHVDRKKQEMGEKRVRPGMGLGRGSMLLDLKQKFLSSQSERSTFTSKQDRAFEIQVKKDREIKEQLEELVGPGRSNEEIESIFEKTFRLQEEDACPVKVSGGTTGGVESRSDKEVSKTEPEESDGENAIENSMETVRKNRKEVILNPRTAVYLPPHRRKNLTSSSSVPFVPQPPDDNPISKDAPTTGLKMSLKKEGPTQPFQSTIPKTRNVVVNQFLMRLKNKENEGTRNELNKSKLTDKPLDVTTSTGSFSYSTSGASLNQTVKATTAEKKHRGESADQPEFEASKGCGDSMRDGLKIKTVDDGKVKSTADDENPSTEENVSLLHGFEDFRRPGYAGSSSSSLKFESEGLLYDRNSSPYENYNKSPKFNDTCFRITPESSSKSSPLLKPRPLKKDSSIDELQNPEPNRNILNILKHNTAKSESVTSGELGSKEGSLKSEGVYSISSAWDGYNPFFSEDSSSTGTKPHRQSSSSSPSSSHSKRLEVKQAEGAWGGVRNSPDYSSRSPLATSSESSGRDSVENVVGLTADELFLARVEQEKWDRGINSTAPQDGEAGPSTVCHQEKKALGLSEEEFLLARRAQEIQDSVGFRDLTKPLEKEDSKKSSPGFLTPEKKTVCLSAEEFFLQRRAQEPRSFVDLIKPPKKVQTPTLLDFIKPPKEKKTKKKKSLHDSS